MAEPRAPPAPGDAPAPAPGRRGPLGLRLPTWLRRRRRRRPALTLQVVNHCRRCDRLVWRAAGAAAACACGALVEPAPGEPPPDAPA